MKLASTILDKKLKLLYDRLELLEEKQNYNPDELQKELADIEGQLAIIEDKENDLNKEKTECDKELARLISKLNSYLSKYIIIMNQCGTFYTNTIAKNYFDFLIQLSHSFKDLELYVETTLNLYGVCYKDNKSFLNEITLFYSDLLALIQEINKNLELKNSIKENLKIILEERSKKLDEYADKYMIFVDTMRMNEKKDYSYMEEMNSIYFKVFSLVSLYETLIRICSKNLVASKELLDELVASSNEIVRMLCCTNIEFGIYDFSSDKSSHNVKLYNFFNQVNLWLNDNNVREEDKMMIIDLAKLIKIKFKINDEYPELEIDYKSGEEYKSYSVNVPDMERNDSNLLFSFADFSEFDNVGSSNRLLPIAQAYILYDLVLSNKIVFDGEEPPFVGEIRQKGTVRKLVNPNADV